MIIAVTKRNVIPQPQWPLVKRYVLKKTAEAAKKQRIINPLISIYCRNTFKFNGYWCGQRIDLNRCSTR